MKVSYIGRLKTPMRACLSILALKILFAIELFSSKCSFLVKSNKPTITEKKVSEHTILNSH